MANLKNFYRLPKLNPPFSFTVRMLNDMYLPICQIKIHQPHKISNLPNFDPSKYTRYMLLSVLSSLSLSLSLSPSLLSLSPLDSNQLYYYHVKGVRRGGLNTSVFNVTVNYVYSVLIRYILSAHKHM